eukprot:Skav206521  [mRNA]  locus=scaffold2251:349339:351782:- [translate_table: standard]
MERISELEAKGRPPAGGKAQEASIGIRDLSGAVDGDGCPGDHVGRADQRLRTETRSHGEGASCSKPTELPWAPGARGRTKAKAKAAASPGRTKQRRSEEGEHITSQWSRGRSQTARSDPAEVTESAWVYASKSGDLERKGLIRGYGLRLSTTEAWGHLKSYDQAFEDRVGWVQGGWMSASRGDVQISFADIFREH